METWAFIIGITGVSLLGTGFQMRTRYSTEFKIAGGALLAWAIYDLYPSPDDPQ